MNLQTAAERALVLNMGAESGENILIVFDETTTKIAFALESAAKKLKIEVLMDKIELTGGHGIEPRTKLYRKC